MKFVKHLLANKFLPDIYLSHIQLLAERDDAEFTVGPQRVYNDFERTKLN